MFGYGLPVTLRTHLAASANVATAAVTWPADGGLTIQLIAVNTPRISAFSATNAKEYRGERTEL